jgi:hypothetical protein
MAGREQWLIIVYGLPRDGTADVARGIAAGLPSKTALVRQADLDGNAIVSHDADRAAELDMVYMQIKLLVSNYLRNGYSVVVDAPYLHEFAGETHSYEDEVEQLRGLMRAMPVTPLTVFLYGQQPVDGSGRPQSAYNPRSGPGTLKFDVSRVSTDQVVETVTGIVRGD